jgi:hypothetical protein
LRLAALLNDFAAWDPGISTAALAALPEAPKPRSPEAPKLRSSEAPKKA